MNPIETAAASEDDQPTLLIVDDTPTNLKVLFTYLHTLNFKLRVAQDGEDALEQVHYAQPDLILLDVMMPNIDGFETCRRLKADKDTRDIPVIFMTALTDTVDKVKGFSLGAVDYITKPIQQEEVLSRINAHLTLYRQQHQLDRQAEALHQSNQKLKDKNKKLDTFMDTLVADLQQPLKLMSGYSRMITHCLKKTGESQAIQYMAEIEQNRHQMMSTIDALLLLNTKETPEFENLDMGEITATAIEKSSYDINKYTGKIEQPKQWPTVIGHQYWVEKVWESLIKHGLHQGGRPAQLKLGAEPVNNKGLVKFWMRTNGIKPSEAQQARYSLPLNQDLSNPNSEYQDLNLSAAHFIVKKSGGSMGLSAPDRQGHMLYFTLPTTA